MAPSALHIVFSISAAAELRKALKQIGSGDSVIALFDDLSFGPINPPSPAVRAEWSKGELGSVDYWDWASIEKLDNAFWTAALSNERRRIVWTSRRASSEYSGFLEFVWRLGDTRCEVIDLTDTMIAFHGKGETPEAPRLIWSLAYISAPGIIANDLMNFACELSPESREGCRTVWARLRDENAPLRVIDANLQLVSAPVTFFDERIRSYSTSHWQKAARVIGNAMLESSDGPLIRQVNDLVLAARLKSMVGRGLLESQGDLTTIRFSEVRLPQK
jgi:hypothetical protein